MTNIDPRYYQILFLSLFLLLGISARDWSLNPIFIVITIGTCLSTQILADFISKKLTKNDRSLFYNLPSALITSLGLSLLLRCNDYSTMILAGILAILSKFLLQFQHKHFFNPANFGIISVLLLTSDAWVSPGQWGDDWWYGLLFLGTGGIILKKVGRWDTTVIFLLSYALLEAIRNLWLGWTFDVFIHRLSSGSLLLFALFMITDPRSIPDAQFSRIIWAIAIAITTFILRNYFYINTAVFWALFMISPLTVILDLIWKNQRFNWQINMKKSYI